MFLVITRRWRPVLFVAVVMFGELSAFLTVAAIVKRPRPDVSHLDSNLPTSAFPSGHTAATACLYVGLAILVIGHAHGWWRYLFLIPGCSCGQSDRLATLFWGDTPTDILAILVFAALWLTATTRLIQPSKDGLRRGGRLPLGLPRRKGTGHSREAEPASR